MGESDYIPPQKQDEPKIGPSFDDIVKYGTDKDGIFDIAKMQGLEGRFGGRCDVLKGPCACGAWH